jgi:hypothetical protein
MSRLAGARPSQAGVSPHAGHARAMRRLAHPMPHPRIITKSHRISMLLLGAVGPCLPQRLFLRCTPSASRNFARIFSPRSLRLCARLGKRGIGLRLAAPGLLSFFAANQPKFLSMNNLRSRLSRFQSGSIKPNQAKSCNFLIITPSPSSAVLQLKYHSVPP